MNQALLSSLTQEWETPQTFFDMLDREFNFTLDPASTHENAKYSKYYAEVVMLIPARTDTKAFHDYILGKGEIRFILGRLKFGKSKNSAPFPSMVVVYGKDVKPSVKFFKCESY